MTKEINTLLNQGSTKDLFLDANLMLAVTNNDLVQFKKLIAQKYEGKQ